MSQVFAQEVFVALAPVLLLVIRRLAYLPEGASRTLEVAEPEYKDLYQLVEDTYESVKSRLETGSSEKLTLRSTGDCDNALVQFLKTLNRILDKHTLREIGKVTVIEEEDLGLDFGVLNGKSWTRVRRLYCFKRINDLGQESGGPSRFDQFSNARLLRDRVIGEKYHLRLIGQLKDVKSCLVSCHTKTKEDHDMLSSKPGSYLAQSLQPSKSSKNLQPMVPMTPPHTPRIFERGTPQPTGSRMWDVEASKTTKHYLQTIIKGIQQRCRKCGKPQKKPSNQAIDVQKKRIADTTVANLLLEGCWSESVTQSRRFEIVFPVRKNEANEAIQHQHSIITIGGSIDEETPTFNACCFEFLPDFSHELSAANNGRLLHKDRKHINDQKEGTGILWPTAKEYSLAHVLRVYELDYREKMRLLLHISRALLDLGNTQWLKDDWGINDIRVYEWQKGSSRHLNIRHPFLSLEVPRRPPKAAKRNNKGGRGQPQKPIETFRYYPIALNLSVVIMQVLLGEKLFSHQNAIYRETPYGDQDKLYSPYQKLHQAKELQKLCLTRFGRGWDIMRVVESCLDSQLFMGNDPDEIFREKIVFPLQTAILNDSGYRIEEQSDRSLKTFFEIEDSFTTADTILQTTVAVQVDPPRTSQKRTHEQMDQSNAETLAASPSLEVSSAQRWLDTISQIVARLRCLSQPQREVGKPLGKKCCDRLVKVAVFDAGFDLQDKRLTKRAPLDGAQPGIVGFKDFVDPFASTMKDYASNKHGTEMAGWVMNIMPLAKVYVARVLYGDKAAAGARREDDCIVEAIKHAIDDWGVDIISMSFAVNERSGPGEKLQRAIEDARNKVSIFAAAGNCRTWENESVAYPARSTDVIRIYSFKGSGASSDFNPEKEPQTKQYLGCIGENLTDPTTKHIASPGTSIATAIAAGIGAIVLDFARFDDEESPDRDWLKDGNTLKQKRVMEHILWNMTQQVPYSHNIIKPQRLFDVTKRGWIKKARTQIGNILDKERTGCL